MVSRRPLFRNILKQYVFLLLILFIFVVAEVIFWLGKEEETFPVLTVVRSLSVGVVFFSSGLELKPQEILSSAKLWQLHLLIQFLNFIMTPVLVRCGFFFISHLMDLDKWIVTGFFALSCLPPPISSAVLLTKASQGNEAIAIINATLGAVLGIIFTPLLLLFHVGLSCTFPVLETLANLLITAIGPFCIGLVAQKIFSPIRSNFKTWIPQIALIFVIFSSFCDMLGQIDLEVSAYEVLVTLILVIFTQTVMIYLYIRVALEVDSTKNAPDLVALIFCSSHKSLTLGLPLLKTLYGGYSHLSQISLPLLIYHPVQLLIGSLLSPFAVKWITSHIDVYN